jgi:superfamily II DNA or RNA helicase/HKD family nuclease
MTDNKNISDGLIPGLYDQLVTKAVAAQLKKLSSSDVAHTELVDPGESHSVVAQWICNVLPNVLARMNSSDGSLPPESIASILMQAASGFSGSEMEDHLQVSAPARRLKAVMSQELPANWPDLPLSRSSLLTGTTLEPSLSSQLCKEIENSDRIDILCSFIKWSGLRLLLPSLRKLAESAGSRGTRIRVISTSYMGATDAKAIQALHELPNTEVKISYDTTRTRLHAKAYLVHRETGFGSAYVGSANISHAAISDGLEWTSKISQYELPYLWDKTAATFEGYWNDDDFELFKDGDLEGLSDAISRERSSQDSEIPLGLNFDLRPYPFQQEILDAIETERVDRGKRQHLVVAATGTGKTMIAAFDYRRFSDGERPPLLYIAHREEILRQALGTFRAVLRDHNFGDLLVGGYSPTQHEHLFCSIQTYNSRELWRESPNRYSYVVVDEFHHAAAKSYRRLLDSIAPDALLGLTATPERADGLDILSWFDHETTAEIRLPSAIGRRLLCPFQYFGISDSVDLSGIAWKSGGYQRDELSDAYTGNDIRALLVLDEFRRIVLDPLLSRTIGFCVSVAHAEFMAEFFNRHGIHAIALSADTPSNERMAAKQKLVQRKVNVIFVVDLYNEGVDIPEIDTVLFLRPTESLTVYLQQLGRGLRLHESKDCLTVLDFIGAQAREFRFADRFRALSTNPIAPLDQEISQGFPHLPAGCSIQLQRIAQEHVLDNVRQSLGLRISQICAKLGELRTHLRRTPTLAEAIGFLGTDLGVLLKKGLWSRTLFESGGQEPVVSSDENVLANGIWRFSHIDDPQQISFARDLLSSEQLVPAQSGTDLIRLTMLLSTLWGKSDTSATLEQSLERLRSNSSAVQDTLQVLEYRTQTTRVRTTPLREPLTGPLNLHSQYSQGEILIALGHWSFEKRPNHQAGVLHLADRKIDAFFVTLNKTESDYSPTTMYEDYAISDRLFHWQSQGATSEESRTGQRYINHQARGYTPLLFVREHKKLPDRRTSPYVYLGPARYGSHTGSQPMSIIWELENPIPARLREQTIRSQTA